MFKATLTNPMMLVNSIATIAELIDDGLFKITKDSISLKSADRAMVAVVDFQMAASNFETYELDGEQNIGVSISTLLSVLKRVGSNDKLTINLLGKTLEIIVEGESKRRFIVPLLDISKEEVPAVDQLDFKAEARVKPEIIQAGIEDAEIVSDSVLFETSGDKFFMRAEGDISRIDLELEKGKPSLMDIRSDGTIRARYPIDYLRKMIKAAKIADSVYLRFAQDYPMRLEFKVGDKISLSFVLAPRVSE